MSNDYSSHGGSGLLYFLSEKSVFPSKEIPLKRKKKGRERTKEGRKKKEEEREGESTYVHTHMWTPHIQSNGIHVPLKCKTTHCAVVDLDYIMSNAIAAFVFIIGRLYLWSKSYPWKAELPSEELPNSCTEIFLSWCLL